MHHNYMHERLVNHTKQAGLEVIQSHPLHRRPFGQYFNCALTNCAWMTGRWGLLSMHKMQSEPLESSG